MTYNSTMQEIIIGETLKTYTGEDYRSTTNEKFIISSISGEFTQVIGLASDCKLVAVRAVLKNGKPSKKNRFFYVSKHGSIYPA